jgi:hypothetical protein
MEKHRAAASKSLIRGQSLHRSAKPRNHRAKAQSQRGSPASATYTMLFVISQQKAAGCAYSLNP